MLYAILARFRPGTEAARAPLRQAFNAHLMQDLIRIRLGGRARETDASAEGIFLLLECEPAQLDAFLQHDPYRPLYAALSATEIDVEVGGA